MLDRNYLKMTKFCHIKGKERAINVITKYSAEVLRNECVILHKFKA